MEEHHPREGQNYSFVQSDQESTVERVADFRRKYGDLADWTIEYRRREFPVDLRDGYKDAWKRWTQDFSEEEMMRRHEEFIADIERIPINTSVSLPTEGRPI